jgi:Bacterial Ig domain
MMNLNRTLLIVTVALASAFSTLGAGDVLLVVQNPVSPSANDAAMRDRLMAFGFKVVLKGDSASTTADANGKVLVLVSSSVGSGNVNTKFRDVAVPVLDTERAIQDEMLMTLDQPTGHGQAAANQTDIIITDSSHPLAAGLPDGQVTVATTPNSTFNWGEPDTNAQVVATVADGSDHPCIYGYDKGAILIDGTTPAPARRVFLYQGDSGLATANSNGVALFDAAVAWSLNLASLGTPPAVTLSQPANGASFTAGANINLQATASDAETSVTKVEFFAGTNKLGEATSGSSIFSFTWTNAPTGRYSLTAKATDTSGATGISSSVKIIVGNPPPLIVMVVGNPAGLTAGEANLKARVGSFGYDVAVVGDTQSSGNDAIGAALIVTSSTMTSANVGTNYQNAPVPVLNWENGLQDDLLMTGPFLNVDYGESLAQTSIHVYAGHPLAGGLGDGDYDVTTSPQTFTWGAPTAAYGGTGAGNPAVVATLNDGSGYPCIYGYDTGALLADGVTPAPARRVETFLSDNTYSACNSNGVKLVDAALSWALNVTLGVPPSVTLIQPANGATFAAGANITLTANATDTDCSVTNVAFYAGSSLLGQDATGPAFTITWSNAPTGIYRLTAQATDNSGLTAVSGAAVIVVGEPPPHVLVVVGNPGEPNISDLEMKAQLESAGYVVTVVGDADSTAADTVGQKLVIISASVTAANVGDKFRDVALPVINMEQGLEGNFLMTLDTASDHGEVYGQTSITITNSAHPLAAGLTNGNYTVATTPDRFFSWGLPAANAVIVATTADANEYPCIFGYDKGELLIDGTTPAPERRIQFFPGDNAYTVMNATGVKLFEAAVNWALPVQPQFNPPAVQSGKVAVSWVGFGTLESAPTVTGPWSEVSGATNPYTTDATGPASFFRLRR